ncbi:MAG TPA: hypothetical protein PK372_05570 [Rugosibacter sp.]|nr:hypothetical protein [Rugosibacter sp.]HQQ35380.1 hypothetical protein [Rugosibacter sp.]
MLTRMRRALFSRRLFAAAALLCAAMFFASVQYLKTAPRQTVNVEMQVALPLFVQVFMAAGDRYLAADVAAIRALVVATEKMQAEDYAVLAKVQGDVSWLNPAHEDNYYIAAAILPWVGQLDAAQNVLYRASQARPFDYQPAFYYAFNLLHFKGDAAGASLALREAAERLPEGDNRVQMQNLAAIWLDKTEDTELAIRVVDVMAKQAKRPDFRRYLEQRVVRLKNLQKLRVAAASYQSRTGRAPTTLDELARAGLIAAVPADPFGFGFAIAKNGQIVLRNSPPRR